MEETFSTDRVGRSRACRICSRVIAGGRLSRTPQARDGQALVYALHDQLVDELRERSVYLCPRRAAQRSPRRYTSTHATRQSPSTTNRLLKAMIRKIWSTAQPLQELFIRSRTPNDSYIWRLRCGETELCSRRGY